MEAKSTYQGWSNYETWAVALWLDNDRDSYEFWRQAAREALIQAEQAEDKPGWTVNEAAIVLLSRRLKEWLTDNMPIPNAGLYTDLLHAALSEVDYVEICKSWMDEMDGQSR